MTLTNNEKYASLSAYSTLPEKIEFEWCIFGGCSSQTHVGIPEGMTIIRDRAFVRCTGLTSLTIAENYMQDKGIPYENY